MLSMPPKEAMPAITEAFGRLTPQESSADVCAHVQALLLSLMRDIYSEDPEMIIKLEPAGEEPHACPLCGSEFVRYGLRYNEKGPERTYRCEEERPHRFTFNSGFERMRYPNALITRAVRLYFKIGSIRQVAGGIAVESGSKPHNSSVSRWVCSMV